MKGAVNADVPKVGPILYSNLEILMLGPGFGLSVLYKYDATFVKTMSVLVVKNSVSPVTDRVSDGMGAQDAIEHVYCVASVGALPGQ